MYTKLSMGHDMYKHTSLICALIDAIKRVYSSICLHGTIEEKQNLREKKNQEETIQLSVLR